MAQLPVDAPGWRFIGPTRGGRVVAVAGNPERLEVFYFGSTGGGVWKTTSAGQRWENISDGYFRTASVGALAIAPSDPNVIYAGMGETTIRNNLSHGDGIYRSTDGGRTWAHCGLRAARHIAKVAVHPRDPDRVYVAALGHAFGPNPERGVYRSTDGGGTWDQMLFINEDTGAVDLILDPANPRVIFATTWEARRGPHFMKSGGPGSGLYRSTDGGDSWQNISTGAGLPEGPKGKIGVALSASRPERIWVIVEHEEGGVFRSDDGGDTWAHLNRDGDLRQRAWYYSHIIADPQDSETVWVLNLDCWKSIDGGRTFSTVKTPHEDHHALWIDPTNPRRMILGCDGGGTISLNGGDDWSTIDNQPTGEFYHVTTDTRAPYRVYGAQQDGSTVSVPSHSDAGGISPADWYTVGGGESGHIAVRPDDPNVVFAGNQQGHMTRYDHRTTDLRDTSIWPEHVWGWDAKDHKHRFGWSFPIILSPHDPGILYAGGNQIFRSTDEGTTWEPISPDLTRNDPSRLQPLQPIGENARGEVYSTVATIAESPLQPGLIWAGSDDGRVHLTVDGGVTWQDVTPDLLPDWSNISIVEPSPHDPRLAYLAADRHKLDDYRPYLLKTTDFGQSWISITDGIAEHDFARVIREDPTRVGLLYAGTESGIYVSIPSNSGAGEDMPPWQRFTGVPATKTANGLPVVPVHDLLIKDDDLVVGTHGRGLWIFEDLACLREWGELLAGPSTHLFKPSPSYRWARIARDARVEEYGVIVRYLLPESLADGVSLIFQDDYGREICTVTGEIPDGGEAYAPARAGLNQFVWDMRYPSPSKILSEGGDQMNARGPRVVPGRYHVQLNASGRVYSQQFTILPDPRVPATPEDLDAQFALLWRIHETLSETNAAINQIRSIRQQITDRLRHAGKSSDMLTLHEAADDLLRKLALIEGPLIQVKANNMEDTLRHPAGLNAKLSWLSIVVGSTTGRPTPQAVALFEELAGRVNGQRARLADVVEADLAVFNRVIAQTPGGPMI